MACAYALLPGHFLYLTFDRYRGIGGVIAVKILQGLPHKNPTLNEHC